MLKSKFTKLFLSTLAITLLLIWLSTTYKRLLPANTENMKVSVGAADNIDITVDGIVIPVSEIPELAAYLTEQADPQTEISRFVFNEVAQTTTAHYIVLGYGCGNKNCHTSLLEISGSHVQSLELGYGIYMKSVVIEDQTKAVMQYGADEGGRLIRSYIIPVDLKKMKLIPFKSSIDIDNYNTEPIWPITDVV